MDANVVMGAIGLVLSTLTIVMAINGNSRKQSERVAVLETSMKFVVDALGDLKKSAGLTRRCTDCPHDDEGRG